MASVVVLPSRGGSQAARRVAPLLLLVVGLILSLIVLPSALNLPQTNPSTTLEYAPVPPTDEDVPPPVGNFSQFGLGRTPSLDTGGAPGGEGDGLAPVETGVGENTSGKRCVNTPRGPKQTEDPLAPPCVPTFDCKENGGETYQGVTKNELRLLVYFDTNIIDTGTSRGDEARPENTYIDLDQQPEPDEHLYARLIRGWARYFEDRFQTYCRHIHFWVYYGAASTASPEAKRADAADNYQRIKPFAVLSRAQANNDAYLEAMAKRGVLNFGSFLGRESSFFSRFPKLIWGYPPPTEQVAQGYVDFFCKQIKPYPATFAGGNLLNKPRRYGLVYPNDPKHPELLKQKNEVMAQIQAKCPINQPGGIPEASWTDCCYAENNGQLPTYASDAMAKFSDPNQTGGPVTTIIWPGGLESKFGDQAQARGYTPEWILTGDGQMDGWFATQYQNPQAFGNHAIIVTNIVRLGNYDAEPCFLAYKDADPSAPAVDIRIRACELYEGLRQMFIGIQVAGPKLGPTSIDKGFHAIPKIASEHPGVPACFYNTNDYTCTKDAAVMWWDASGEAPNSADPGCWRMFQDGKRYLFDQFPQQEVWSLRKTADPCNNWSVRALRYLAE